MPVRVARIGKRLCMRHWNLVVHRRPVASAASAIAFLVFAIVAVLHSEAPVHTDLTTDRQLVTGNPPVAPVLPETKPPDTHSSLSRNDVPDHPSQVVQRDETAQANDSANDVLFVRSELAAVPPSADNQPFKAQDPPVQPKALFSTDDHTSSAVSQPRAAPPTQGRQVQEELAAEPLPDNTKQENSRQGWKPWDTPSAGIEHARRLKARLVESMKTVVPTDGRPVALLDFPDHGNSGDSAIWLGEKALLRDLNVKVVYACRQTDCNFTEIGNRLRPNGVILLHGGGNFGDIWPGFMNFRYRVFSRFRDLDIVQMPQTAHFTYRENITLAQRWMKWVPRLTLLARDFKTMDLFTREFPTTRAELVPDMAWMLVDEPLFRSYRDPNYQPTSTTYRTVQRPSLRQTPDVMWIKRGDKEALRGARSIFSSATRQLRGQGVMVRQTDWFCPAGYAQERRLRNLTFDQRAEKRVTLALDILHRSRVVVADRLHAVILSTLLDLPVVSYDNGNGKLSTYYETWGRFCSSTHWAPDVTAIVKNVQAVRASRPGQAGEPDPNTAEVDDRLVSHVRTFSKPISNQRSFSKRSDLKRIRGHSTRPKKIKR